MAETLLFNFAEFVVGQLSSTVVDEVKLALGVEDELDRIKSNLFSIQAVLRDAEKQQTTSASVANWLRNLQDVMYDIDDLLDEIATEVSIHKKNKGHWRKQVRRFFSRRNVVVLRQLWAHHIKNICKKLDQIAEERRNFVFFPEPADSQVFCSRETHSKINKSEILGRDQDVEAMMSSILSCGDCESISVLPIVGLGAIGKTTLAKLIFNDNRIDEIFDNKFWVYVSNKFNIKKILKQVLSMVTGENMVQLTMKQLTLEQLRIRISEALKDTKYFLILDDLWSEDSNEWRRLKELLDVGAKGSTVVVTTRDLKVATMIKSIDEYILSELSPEICLRLFKQLAFKDGEGIEPTLLDLAEKIVEKSRGLPLLITTLGNLLHGKTEREWHHVVQKLEQGHEDIINILKLSYEQLPSFLKLCFRFCSIYGKGSHLSSLDLLYLWMALGFLPYQDQGEALEYIGRKCINELSSKSLFQYVKDALDFPDDFRDLLMHDFVYDLAKSMTGDEVAIVNCMTEEISENVRYIRLDEDYLSGKQFHTKLLKKAKKARFLVLKTSEHPLSKSFLKSIISKLKCLRALDLDKSQFLEMPRTIGYMMHLRYLSLENNMGIRLLPDSICNLLNLQTLALHGCTNLQELPANIERLENLRVLTVTTQEEVLAQGIGLLSNLRVLIIQECPRLAYLPPSTKQLQNLEILSLQDCKELDLAQGSWSLEGLNNLRILLIGGLPKFQKLLTGVKGLPFTSLQLLVVHSCEGLTEIMDWINSLTSLRILMIRNCPNLVGSLHVFDMLKRLETLWIKGCPLLSQSCAPGNARDWHLISDTLESVTIEGEIIV